MSTNISSTEQIVEINAGDQITNVNIVSQSTTQIISGEQVVTIDTNAGTIPAAWGSITGTLSNQADLQAALNLKQNNITLTTTGTSGAATLVGATLNIPNYTDTGLTSVGLAMPTGFDVSGSPLTSNGTLNVNFASGYSLPTTTKQGQWDQAYNDKINSAEVSGTTTKTLTLTQQDGGIIQASWSDIDTAPVQSVFGRTGNVVAAEGDYNLNQLGDVTITTATNGQVLKYNGTAWVNDADAIGLTSVGVSMPSAFNVSGSPLTSNGTIAITGAGTTSQYIRGDGSLATFPSVASEAKTLIREVYNSTGATLAKGTVVYINGGQGNLPTVTKALAVGDITSAQTFGIVQSDITNMNNGFVVVAGGIDNLDTQAYSVGTALYLSPTTAGAWTTTKPYAPDHLVYLGVVVRSHPTQGVIEVKIQNGYELDELHNVSARFPSNKDGLFYNTANSVWENKSIEGVLGYTPVPNSRIITINGTAQDLSADRTYNVGTVTSVNATVPTGFEVSGVPITSTGTIDIKFASGYSLPTTAKQTEWDTAYTKRIDSLTVTGNSGSASLVSNILNIPTYTLTGLGGEPAITAGTTLQYFRGDKTFQTLDTSVVPENGPIYFTEPRVRNTVITGVNITGGSIVATDSVLTAFGKLQNQINGLIGGSIFQSTWNATTNTPTLTSSVGTKGYYYIVSTAGSTDLDGITDWQIGDWAIFDGTVWRKVDNTDAVVSVNGFTGIVNLALDNISDVSATSPTGGQLLRFNGTSSVWENWTPTYISAAITSLNGLTGAVQTMVTGTAGSDFTIDASGTVHTFNIPTASATKRGLLSSADFTTFNNKQATITLTTTGTSGAATFISNTLNIPQYQAALTNPVTGTGTAAQIAYFSNTSQITGSSTFTFSPTSTFSISNTATAGSGQAVAMNIIPNVNAAANDDILYGVRISPTFSNGVFTGVTQRALGVFGNVYINGTITSGTWNGTVIGAAYGGAGTVSGILKANGSGTVSAAVAGTDYVAPSALSSYLPLTGGTLTGALSGTSATFNAGSATNVLTLTGIGNGVSGAEINNTNAGSSARTQVQVNSDTASGYFFASSSTNVSAALGGRAATVGMFTASGNTTGGIAILARNAAGYITFHTGGNSERVKIASNGETTFNNNIYLANGSDIVITPATSGVNATLYNDIGKLVSTASLVVQGTGEFSGALSGTSATFSSTLTTNGGIAYVNGTTDAVTYYQIGGTTGGHVYLTSTKLELSAYSTRNIVLETNGVTRLTITSTGAATFSSSAAKVMEIQSSTASGGYVRYTYNTTTSIGYIGSSSQLSGLGAVSDLELRADNNLLLTTTSGQLRITSGGNVQINDSFSSAKFAIRGGTGTYPSSSSATYTLSLNDPTSMAANVGGSIIFQGYKTSNTNIGNFAFIVGKKQNGTAGDESGFLGFGTSDSAGTISERMRITSGGDVGIGNITPKLNGNSGTFTTIYNASASAWLELATASTTDGLGGAVTFNNTNRTGTDKRIASIVGVRAGANDSGELIFTTWNGGTGTNQLTISKTGAATFTSSVTATSFFESSDIRLKTNIQDFNSDVSKISAKIYEKNGITEIGYIAQDVDGILSSAVSKREDGFLDLSYRQIHTAKIAMLENRIKELEAKLK